jgi:hypothetical protein
MWIKRVARIAHKKNAPRDYRGVPVASGDIAALQIDRQLGRPTGKLNCGCRGFLGAVRAVSISGANAI